MAHGAPRHREPRSRSRHEELRLHQLRQRGLLRERQVPALQAARSDFIRTARPSSPWSRRARHVYRRVGDGRSAIACSPTAPTHAHGVCNWLTPAGRRQRPLLAPASSTGRSPTCPKSGSLPAWRELERAKKRLVYSLLRFGLPLDAARRRQGPARVRFRPQRHHRPPRRRDHHRHHRGRRRRARAPAPAFRRALSLAARPPAARERAFLLDGAGRGRQAAEAVSRAVRRRARRTTRKALGEASCRTARRPTGRSGTCRPTPARIRGRTGRRRGRSICTSSTRSIRRTRKASSRVRPAPRSAALWPAQSLRRLPREARSTR